MTLKKSVSIHESKIEVLQPRHERKEEPLLPTDAAPSESRSRITEDQIDRAERAHDLLMPTGPRQAARDAERARNTSPNPRQRTRRDDDDGEDEMPLMPTGMNT